MLYLIVNDYPDIALAADADGVHLGQDDLPLKEARKIMGKDKIIGDIDPYFGAGDRCRQIRRRLYRFRPDISYGNKGCRQSKRNISAPRDKSEVHIPVVAIGGINLENVRSVLEAGADAVAVASAILRGDIEENAERFLNIIRSCS